MGDERNGDGRGVTLTRGDAERYLQTLRMQVTRAGAAVRQYEAEVQRHAEAAKTSGELLGYARSDLEALAAVEGYFARLLGVPSACAPPPQPPAHLQWASPVPRLGLITDVLREAGRPLPVSAIVEAVEAAGMPLPTNPYSRRQAVYGCLYLHRGKRFVQNDAHEWGLAPTAAGEEHP